jgi:hypothetical protein
VFCGPLFLETQFKKKKKKKVRPIRMILARMKSLIDFKVGLYGALFLETQISEFR